MATKKLKTFLFWQQFFRYFIYFFKTEVPREALIWVFFFIQWGIIIGLVVGSVKFILVGVYGSWKRRHFPKFIIRAVWPRLLLKLTKKVPIVQRFFCFLYASLTAHRLPLEQKRHFIKTHEHKTQLLSKISLPNLWRSKVRGVFPNWYRIRYQYSFEVLKTWKNSRDPIQKYLKEFGKPRPMRRKKKPLCVKMSVKIQTRLRWLKYALLKSGQFEFYGVLADLKNHP